MSMYIHSAKSHPHLAFLIIGVLLAILMGGSFFFLRDRYAEKETEIEPATIDGARMMGYVNAQHQFGPRVPGTAAHEACVAWLQRNLEQSGWKVEIQDVPYRDGRIQNLTARRGGRPPQIILGAHYDSRPQADQDPLPANHPLPVPGANDGASGTAVLLELARTLPQAEAEATQLVFLDAEDSGGINGWEWAAGAQAFVDALQEKPGAAVILDMVGDRALTIYQEINSDAELTAQIWQAAKEAGYADVFVPQKKFAMFDDHIPFLKAGIPAVDVIDFDYPDWHKVSDTPDKLSAESLQITALVMRRWISTYLADVQ